MHGPYKEYRGEILVEEGHYYLGTKHGRWVTYDGNMTYFQRQLTEKVS
jgi:hypothetical protein